MEENEEALTLPNDPQLWSSDQVTLALALRKKLLESRESGEEKEVELALSVWEEYRVLRKLVHPKMLPQLKTPLVSTSRHTIYLHPVWPSLLAQTCSFAVDPAATQTVPSPPSRKKQKKDGGARTSTEETSQVFFAYWSTCLAPALFGSNNESKKLLGFRLCTEILTTIILPYYRHQELSTTPAPGPLSPDPSLFLPQLFNPVVLKCFFNQATKKRNHLYNSAQTLKAVLLQLCEINAQAGVILLNLLKESSSSSSSSSGSATNTTSSKTTITHPAAPSSESQSPHFNGSQRTQLSLTHAVLSVLAQHHPDAVGNQVMWLFDKIVR